MSAQQWEEGIGRASEKRRLEGQKRGRRERAKRYRWRDGRGMSYKGMEMQGKYISTRPHSYSSS